jgi:predicted acetyltransferase
VAYDIVPIGEAELPVLHRVIETAFGHESIADRLQDEYAIVEYDRWFGVQDGAELVGGGGAYTFELTVPGSEALPAAGVTWIGVLPTHRRRGILTQMMTHQLDDVVERGEPVAILTASEGAIYGRYGYGVATQVVEARIRQSRGQFHRGPATGGRLRLLWGDDRKAPLMDVYDRWRRQRAGALSRKEGLWDIYMADREYRRQGASALFVVVHETESGEVDGYARYRTRDREEFDDKLLVVQEVIATDPEVEAALWRYLLDVDLVGDIEASFQQIDDPLQWRLRDPRSYDVKWRNDWMWARLLDVPVALSARTYASEGSLVFEVIDPRRPRGGASGRFQLDGGPDGASCKPTDATPEVTLPVEVLGSVWLGGVPLSTYVRAGRAEATPAAVARADAMFRATPLPYCNTPF